MTYKSDYRQRMLEQTSNDYDVPLHIVEEIYRKYPDTFYDAMENYIKQRSNGNKESKIYV